MASEDITKYTKFILWNADGSPCSDIERNGERISLSRDQWRRLSRGIDKLSYLHCEWLGQFNELRNELTAFPSNEALPHILSNKQHALRYISSDECKEKLVDEIINQ